MDFSTCFRKVKISFILLFQKCLNVTNTMGITAPKVAHWEPLSQIKLLTY